MKTHEITTSKGEFVVANMEHNSWFQNTPIPEGYTTQEFIKLSEATEQDAELIVDKSEAFQLYRNYLKIVEFGNKMEFTSPLESFHSLLKSKGIDVNNGGWYLFKKI